MYVLRALARLSWPVYVLLAALTYTLGAGIARYLGTPSKLGVLVLGLVSAVLAQGAMSLLAAVFRRAADPLIEDETLERRRMVRNAALYTSIAMLAAIGFIGFVIQGISALSTSTLLCMGFSLLAIVLYAVPPARALDRGFGELLLAVQMAYLIPSIGFLLQAGSYHRLLNACTAALTLLLASTLVALQFPSYADDLEHKRATLLIRMGWENAVRVHHALVFTAYLLFGISAFLGFSFGLFSSAFLTIPFAVLQVLLLRNIARGARPIWNLLRANAVAIFGLTAYFLTLSFWLR